MDLDSPQAQAYLSQLNQMTNGDPDVQVSMYDVGNALGLEKDASGQLAESLFIGGHAELKTLSGGIGITSMGLKALGLSPASDMAELSLGDERVLTDAGRHNLDRILSELKPLVAARQADYEVLASVIMDVKTIEVHLLSPQPKSAVAREVLRSIAQALPEKDFADIRGRITTMVGQP